MEQNEKLKQCKEWIQEADAIIIGAGSGLSSAAGYNHYHWESELEKPLLRFKDYYQFQSPFAGFYYFYNDYESQWGYYSQYIQAMMDAPVREPYLELKKLVQDKPHFVLTTNIDMQFERIFDKKNICSFQGDFSYLQCSQPCHDELIDAKPLVTEMTNQLIDGLRIPSELVPRCKVCGRVLVPWVRDNTFLEGKDWKEAYQRYVDFASYWINEKKKKVLLLELGVGEMTPSIIKLPFWKMTAEHENVRYACLNLEDTTEPEHIKEKSLYIQGDLKKTLTQLNKCL